jgi:apolipoprotein N-acyltransferase
MKPSWSIRLVRAMFFALSVFVGIAIALGMEEPAWVGALLGLGYMGVLLGLDVVFARFTLRDFSLAGHSRRRLPARLLSKPAKC